MIYFLSDFLSFVVDVIRPFTAKVLESTPMWRNTQFESQGKEVSRWCQKVPEGKLTSAC